MKKLLGFLLLFILTSRILAGQNTLPLEKHTFLYAVRGQDSLYLDTYAADGKNEMRPCVLFVFGGGFVGGERNADYYLPYFRYLAEQGYVVVTIDYRLGLRHIREEKELPPERFARLLAEAVNMAVEDLYTATAYVLKRTESWNIDKSRLIASGSSAGAITVLQAEYGICNKIPQAAVLPEGFNYAGIIAFAGAIFGGDTGLTWQRPPAPIQLFHGDADDRVPFYKAGDTNGWLYGSGYIAEQLTEKHIPHYFCRIIGTAHEVAVSPMNENQGEIGIFLDKLVKEKQPLIIDTQIRQIGKPVLNKELQMMDYIRNNFR